MGNVELLSDFTAKVEEFAKYQDFIDKARAQSGKFAAKVVEKVITTNTEKIEKVVEEIIPLLPDMEAVVDGLKSQRAEVLSGRENAGEKLEELDLRKAIGELTDEEYELEAAELKEGLESIDGKVAAIDAELNAFTAQFDKWLELGEKAGVLAPPAPEPEPEPEPAPPPPVATPAPSKGGKNKAVAIPQEEVAAFEEAPPRAPAASSSGMVVDDVSAVFQDDGDDNLNIDVGDIDIIGDEPVELEADGGAEPAAADDRPRRAVLLYQEGTAEEVIHQISGELLTLGRGRDNDVQVKNDSKVSRYHCKIYRRGPNFYVEDNKSANGTLVNGELITERRLFGGEEVIIGETFFRFRILD